MPVSKNKDRYQLDESFDATPLKVQSIFNSANNGYTKKQSRLANELTEKDPAISQAWSVRVAAIAACPWEITGGTSEQNKFIERALKSIQPSFDSGLVSFNKLLQSLQSAVMLGFSTNTIEWGFGDESIDGFKIFDQSLFSFQDSDLPYFTGKNSGIDGTNQEKVTIYAPRWMYHTATNSRGTEPLRSGLVRPLAYIYTFRRHVQIEYSRGLEKFALPMPAISVDGSMYDDENSAKMAVQELMESWTYDGYSIVDKQTMEITFPTANSGFSADMFKSFLEFAEKQIFRLILGQDSTSSSDNSNRSTAQVHNLVRADMLASDANAVEETVNNQIIKPLWEASPQSTGSNTAPVFRFRLKGVAELQEMANVLKTLKEAGKTVPNEVISERMGLPIEDIEEGNETEAVENGND
tara:strand:+ start:1038 stop:2267 length:1230 start_codon:yes stop_codon:yes gene_type:complete